MMDHSHSFINGYLLIIFHVTGNVLGARNTIINEQWTLLLRVSKIIKSQDEKYIFVICFIFFKSEGLPSLETSRRQALTLQCEGFTYRTGEIFTSERKQVKRSLSRVLHVCFLLQDGRQWGTSLYVRIPSP